MKYAIISDIHSNIEALNTVLKEIDKLKIKNILSPGDIIGYSCFAEECADIFRKRKITTVLGNHEAAAIGKLDLHWFNTPARFAIERNFAELSEKNEQFIKKLKTKKIINNVLLVHARPPDNFTDYIRYPEEDLFSKFRQKICIIGHTHIPMIIEYKDNKIKLIKKTKITLNNSSRYILNPGSVGQPRDNNPKASFGILTDNSFEIKRIKYNIKKTADEMVKRGLSFIFFREVI